MNEEDVQENTDEQKQSITAYLQAPRKKRKNYVIIAVTDSFDSEYVRTIESYVKKYHPALAMAKPQNVKELRRFMNRNISLVILDDEFAPLVPMLEIIKTIREARRKEAIPILFLTRNAGRLIETYHGMMGAYQEIDDLLDYVNIDRSQLLGRVKLGIEQKNRRRSRRFKAHIDINFHVLSKDRKLPGKLVDLSMHGALIESASSDIFKIGEQLKLMIPGGRFLGEKAGEFLRMSAKVRRVHINGSTAGVSFEYVTESQTTVLTKIIANIMTKSISGKT